MPSVSTHNSARRDSSRPKLGCSAAFAFTGERARHPVGSVTADFSADVMLSDSLRYTSSCVCIYFVFGRLYSDDDHNCESHDS